MAHMNRKLLVTGGSGRLARQIMEILLSRGGDQIITTTRTPAALADLQARGVEVRYMDFDDEIPAIASALAGADRMLMISTHAVGRRAEQQGKVVTAAMRAGVPYFLYTSCTSPAPTPLSAVVSDHFGTELALMASSLRWTLLRHNMYTEHAFLFLPTSLESGELRTSIADGARSYVTRTDCAAADAAALAADWTDNRIYDVGGSEALTTDDLLQIVCELTGKRIKHVRVSDAESIQQLNGAGLPPGFPEAIVGFDIWARQGYHAVLAPAVRELTGREPESLRAFVARHLDVLHAGKARHDV
jgi:NAD(P)H dehydrogenase (quinone)